MKVAFFTYPPAFQNIGGGEIQLLKTREYLQKAGQPVDLFDIWSSKVEDYDLLHVFSSVGDSLGLIRAAKAKGTKVVVSPVLWIDWKRGLFDPGNLKTKADFTLRYLTKFILPSFPSDRRSVLMEANRLLPNSLMEKKQIARLFAVPEEKIDVVPNGVERVFENAEPAAFRSKVGDAPFILSVGRIEPRKNQLNLIRALKNSGKKLVLIGSPVGGYEDYFKQCQIEGDGFTLFFPTMTHDDPALKSAYAACEVFVLPAWFETPGLAGLEAALAGARLVVTEGGSTQEYFGDHVQYVDPANPEDIAKKISLAVQRAPSENLKKHILNNFTWEKTAERTLEAYRKAVNE